MSDRTDYFERSHQELEAGQAASRRRVEQLIQSLLHRAFNGEL